MKTAWTVRIDGWLPARVNELLNSHWAVAKRRKDSDRQMLQVACAKIPKAKGKRRVTLTWILGPTNKVKPDPDGVWKSLLDGLVRNGHLVDDHSHWCELMPVQFDRAKTKGILLTLEDV